VVPLEQIGTGPYRSKRDVQAGEKSEKESERYFGHYFAIFTDVQGVGMGGSKLATSVAKLGTRQLCSARELPHQATQLGSKSTVVLHFRNRTGAQQSKWPLAYQYLRRQNESRFAIWYHE
jgi:hypothetical protein